MQTDQFSLPFADLPPLTEDERDDACFRGKDRAWSALAGLFDEMAENDPTVTYQSLGDRIGRSRSQVQRWMDAPHNVTLRSLSLLAEGLDADLILDVKCRIAVVGTNQCHPADDAKSLLPVRLYLARTDPVPVRASAGMVFVPDWSIRAASNG